MALSLGKTNHRYEFFRQEVESSGRSSEMNCINFLSIEVIECIIGLLKNMSIRELLH